MGRSCKGEEDVEEVRDWYHWEGGSKGCRDPRCCYIECKPSMGGLGNFLIWLHTLQGSIVNKIWSQGESTQRAEVYEVDSTTMKFRVSNPMMRARILRRGMWNIRNIPLVVTKWTPDELKEKPEVKSIPWKSSPFHYGFISRMCPFTCSCGKA